MSTLYVDRKNASLDLEGDAVVVRVDGERQGGAPLNLLERVVVRGSAQIGARLLTRLAARGVAFLAMTGSGSEETALLMGRGGNDASLKLAQYALAQNEPAREAFSAALIRAKISAQFRFLQEAAEAHPSKPLRDAMEALARAEERLLTRSRLPTRAELRGVEGAAASAYFGGFTTLFAPAMRFEGRNRRPPRDPVNVVLSLGYTLLHAEAVRRLVCSGLDPLIGVYHDLSFGRESLACDLCEPVRPLVDRWARRIFDERRLEAASFTYPEQGGCRMGKAARAEVYASFEEDAPLMRRLLERETISFVKELRAQAPARLPPSSKTDEERISGDG